MPQIKLHFGLDKTQPSSGPYSSWFNLLLKKTQDWSVAFVEIDGKSYGDLLKPTQDHKIEMTVNADTYEIYLKVNNKVIQKYKHYFSGNLVISTTNSNITENQLVDKISESFYDH